MNTISIITSQNIELEYDLGSLGDRIVGRILDGLVLVGYGVILAVLIGFGNIESFISSNPWIIILFVFPVVFYDLLSEIFMNGQSVGKKVMGIKVVSLNGEQPSLSQYLLRWVFRIVDFTFSGSLVALIMVAASEKKQRLGDLVAGTVLVKTKPRTQFTDTWYQPTEQPEYVVTYPEVINLKDSDIQLLKEVLNSVSRSGNVMLALQAQQKIERVLNIHSKHMDSKQFLHAVLADYNHLTSQL
jgi:uncharacterized RDD family membrane protein YckC